MLESDVTGPAKYPLHLECPFLDHTSHLRKLKKSYFRFFFDWRPASFGKVLHVKLVMRETKSSIFSKQNV